MKGKKTNHHFAGKEVSYYWNANFQELEAIASRENTVLLTDAHLFSLHSGIFTGWRTIVIDAGEIYKTQSTADKIIMQLIEMEAGRDTLLIGVGGGVVTDIAGYVAGIYMRGITCALVPSSILGMVDAAIGGKSGVDVGPYKNMVGLIRQPEFVFLDYQLLQTLPQEEWINGFAEIVKHACIRDTTLFASLESHTYSDYKTQPELLATLIEQNVAIKTSIVQSDEFENGDRRLLNFGHTLGHAIENLCNIPHGQAISIGMMAAAELSVELVGLSRDSANRLRVLLQRYHLPVHLPPNVDQCWQLLKMDKKRKGQEIRFVLLQSIGKGIIVSIPLQQLEGLIEKTLLLLRN